MTCDRESEYEILHKRIRVGDEAALNFGGCVHKGLDVRYNRPHIPSPNLLKDMYDAALGESVEKRPFTPGDWRTKELLWDVMQRYVLTYPTEEFEVLFRQSPEGPKPCVELPFAIPLGTITLNDDMLLSNKVKLPEKGPNGEDKFELQVFNSREIPVVWIGKMDMLIKKDGMFWIVDHKTTSIFGATYYNQYYLSNQMTGYAWAAQEALKQRVSGVMINVIAIRKPTPTGKGIEFGRQYIDIPHFRVAEWKRDTLALVSRFFNNMLDGYFPKKTVWCVTKFSKQCQYWDVCTTEDEKRFTMLYSNLYKEKTWSPLND